MPPSKNNRQKVLLMGRSGSGKTSMRQVIFSSDMTPGETERLGATVDVESSNVRLLGNLSLNILDCGGQQSYMDGYLSTQRQTIFKNVAVLIYVFDTKSRDWEEDVRYFEQVLEGLAQMSGDDDDSAGDDSDDQGSGQPKKKAGVYVLINKMDLEDPSDRARIERERAAELLAKVKSRIGGRCMAFGTSIWDESLYKAWSAIVRSLIPNAHRLIGHLSRLREKAHAAEAVLFERQTFLVVARSAPLPPRVLVDGRLRRPKTKSVVDSFSGHEDQDNIIAAGAVGAYSESPADVGAPNRYEVVSDIFKMFRIAINTTIGGGEMDTWLSDFRTCSVAIEAFTTNTYCMLLSNDLRADAEYLLEEIRVARAHFEELHTGTVHIKCALCAKDGGMRYLFSDASTEREDREESVLGLRNAVAGLYLQQSSVS